jgi:glycosyltransferase involved in cell wall biosynthesis
MSVTASSDAVPATEVLAEARAVGASQRGRLRTPVDIEVVIPAYNESARLPETLRQSVAYLDRQPWRSRLVVVDNGSVDETAADARIAAAGTDKVDVTVIGCSRAGKGAAVRRGLLTSTSPLVGFFDADLATPLETLEPTVEALRAALADRA